MFAVTVQKGLEGLPEAKAIRTEVFVREQGFHNEFDETDAVAYHAVVWQDGEAIATGRTFPAAEAGVFTVGRLAVRKAWRGTGAGAAALRALEQQARACGAESVTLMSQLTACGFYEKNGYQAYGDICMDEHCPHIWMRKILN